MSEYITLWEYHPHFLKHNLFGRQYTIEACYYILTSSYIDPFKIPTKDLESIVRADSYYMQYDTLVQALENNPIHTEDGELMSSDYMHSKYTQNRNMQILSDGSCIMEI
jgi:hypothetical protein